MREASDSDRSRRRTELASNQMGTLEHIADLQRRMSGVGLHSTLPALAS